MRKLVVSLTAFLLTLYSLRVLAQDGRQQEEAAIAQDSVSKKSFARRILDYYVNDEKPSRKLRILTYPLFAYTPETRLEVGVSSLLLFHARNDETNRLSELQALGFYTANRQYGLWLDHALYTNRDQWFFLGRVRYQFFPLLYYGIGRERVRDNPAVVNSNLILVRERLLKRISGNFFAGLEIDFQNLYNVQFESRASTLPLPLGANGSSNLGLGLGLVYDNRKNVLNVRKGFFAELAYLNYNSAWGSDFSFQAIQADVRYFRPFPKNQVLALQLYGVFQQGEVPFNQLALLGGETIMRGYYLGRYRDRNYVATQAEYRFLPFPFFRRIGGAIFFATGAVAGNEPFSLSRLLPTGGIGLRYLLFPKKDVYLRFDFALTREGNGFYIFNGESF
jgi:hypothetical protein